MPKLVNKNPRLGQKEGRAVVRYRGATHYLKKPDGSSCKPGTKEALAAYNRLCLELQNNCEYTIPRKYALQHEEPGVMMKELAAGYLTYSEARHTDYANVVTIIRDFLLPLYGGGYLVESFTPKCLKNVRDAMIKSQRFSRGTINNYCRRIVAIFAWGVGEELVQETTHRALKLVKQLDEGHPGTWENAPREDISFDVVTRLLPFLVPVLRAMVQIQGLHGMRSGEVCNMRVGEIDRTKEQKTGFWYYTPASHKTQKKTGKKTIFPLGKYEQELLLPYLEGKSDTEAVFSPAQAMRERAAVKRTSRKTKMTPSSLAKEKERAAKPKQYSEFYTPEAYRKSLVYAMAQANKQLPEDEQIPHFFPYLLRRLSQ